MGLIYLVGLVTVVSLVIKVIYNLGGFIYTTLVGPMLGHNLDLRKCGPWAVVTGATDGIGKAYSKQLAAAGLNIVLISRTPAKLEKVAEEIKRINGSIEIKTIAVDFTDGHTIYPKLKAEMNQLEVGLLVNNVGMAIGFGIPFIEIINEQELSDIVNCNITSMIRMTHIVLPQMLRRKKGVIINIGSEASVMPTPLLSVYGGTKAFVDKFSGDLETEIKDSGVIIQALHPGLVVSNMSKVTKPTINGPDADTFAKAALSSIGLETRTAGYWFHKIEFYWWEMGRFFFPKTAGKLMLKAMADFRKTVLEANSKSK